MYNDFLKNVIIEPAKPIRQAQDEPDKPGWFKSVIHNTK